VPHVLLRAPLSELAGAREISVAGTTVGEALVALEHARPGITGWVLDERRSIRQHVNVYVNGQPAREEEPVVASDRIHVLPAITGG
jgi:molybdopterin synthase sulfur carrier subunit